MKKMLALVSALCMMCAVVPVLPVQESTSISASAEDLTYQNLKYRNKGTYVLISGITDTEMKEVIIPDKIEDLEVRGICDNSFLNCTALETVVLPDSVTQIGMYCFKGCVNLKNINLPAGVKTITNNTFENCTSLEQIVFPESLTSIGSNAFCNTGLKEVEIPAHVTALNDVCFAECKKLEKVSIAEGVQNIGRGSFKNCSSLVSASIPSTACLGYQIFENCTSLTDVSIAEGAYFDIARKGTNMFAGCTSLERIHFPKSFTCAGGYMFADCDSLTEIDLPENVENIWEEAFMGCDSLKKVIIRNPKCVFTDKSTTICNTYENNNVVFDGVICGYEGSTAQAYAEKYHYQFEVLSSEPETEEPTEIEPETAEPTEIETETAEPTETETETAEPTEIETETQEETLKLGDASGDGRVDIIDVIVVNKAVLGKEIITDAQLKAIDFNENGKPDPDEALTLLKYIVGITTELK